MESARVHLTQESQMNEEKHLKCLTIRKLLKASK